MIRESGKTLKGDAFYMDWLEERKRDQLFNLFTKDPQEALWHWICSSSDWGVVRNGGRRGAAHAPQAIKATYSKLYQHHSQGKYYQWETSEPQREAQDFICAQQEQALRIQHILHSFPQKNYLHLGGGHDHVYPFVKAIFQTHPQHNIHVLNLDAHLDTRIEREFHSGTPFRQLLEEYPQRLRLTQIGIQARANPISNYEGLNMEVYTFQDLEKLCSPLESQNLKQWAQENLQKKEGEIQVLSLDCDVLDAHVMEAVSAVNGQGFPLAIVSSLFEFYCQNNLSQNCFMGIYEMNPLYDNLSQKGALAIGSLLFKVLNEGKEKKKNIK